jgi:uncharacterized protein YidB (DUF937 family)
MSSATLWIAAHLLRSGANALLLAREDDMGFLDGILGGVVGAEALSLVKGYFEKHGGIQGVVNEFEKNGFGQQAKSWVGTGPNAPITKEQVHQTIGLLNLKDLANKYGVPVDKVSELLAKYVPAAIDKATPDGKLPS